MRLITKIQSLIIEIVSLLYIILFVYAAVSKLLDFENFQVQLGQSPLLSAFAGSVSYTVPIVELLIVALLLIRRLRYWGLFAAFCLMIMFTVYIIIILNYSPFIPCSCGGILEKLNWHEHLIFNIVFTLLALIAVLLERSSKENKYVQLPLVFGGTLCSVILMTLLFFLSEDIIHHRNNFIRRFPQHPITLSNELDLKFNSYYIAGVSKTKVYLGNRTSPLLMTVLDSSLQKQKFYKIELPKSSLNFHSFQIHVKDPYFYITDGTSPYILRGNVSDWKAKIWNIGASYFNAFALIDNATFAIRALSSVSNENVLGTVKIAKKPRVKLASNILVKQIDGVFDTDGMLLYNAQINKLVYTYYYRNEFMIIDTSLITHYVSHTIDTTSKAKIKVTFIKSKQQTKLSSPRLIINKKTTSYGHYLFINSGLMGKYEPREMWEVASIIDVYDLRAKSYAFSFYIDDKRDDKLKELLLNGNDLICLTGHYISKYMLQKQFTP
jgi:uncharacterized membrane protein YhaH (DUF805 family)